MDRAKSVSISFFLVVGLIIFAVPELAFAEESMQITIAESIVSIHAGQKALLRYRYNSVPFKPYADRLFSPAGVNILRDGPADHQHHHGLMFAVAVDGVNFWEEHKAPGRQVHQCFSDVTVDRHTDIPWAGLTEQLAWLNPSGKELLLNEHRTIRLCQPNDAKVILLTWESLFEVPEGKKSVTLTGSHYFGLGIRFVESMDTEGQFRNADGKVGDVVRGDERLIRSRWCAFTASADGRPVTVAMLDHPKNQRRVTWFTMTKPFAYLSATLNLHKEPLKLTSDTLLVLRYGVALWDGRVKSDQIEQLYQRWAAWPGERKTTLN